MSAKIISMNVVGDWTYPEVSSTKDICELCDLDILGPSRDNLAAGILASTIIFGKCGHCFHSECFQKIHDGLCPKDKTQWETKKEISPESEYSFVLSILKEHKKKSAINQACVDK